MDLFARGWDLLDYFRGSRPWQQLFRLIHRLPADSHFQAALAMDEERGKYLASLPVSDKREPLSPQGYTLEAMLLLRQNDLIKNMTRTLVGVMGGKPGEFEPEPRPSPAVERIRAAMDRASVASVLAAHGVS